MPEWLGMLIVLYGVVTVYAAIYLGVSLSSAVVFGGREKRKRAARRLLLAPFWPFYGIYRLIQIARTGE